MSALDQHRPGAERVQLLRLRAITDEELIAHGDRPPICRRLGAMASRSRADSRRCGPHEVLSASE
jgi:hypothetical protein